MQALGGVFSWWDGCGVVGVVSDAVAAARGLKWGG